MNTTPLDILLVEADSTTAMAIQQALSQLGHLVTYACNAQMALEASARRKLHLAILSTDLEGNPASEKLTKHLSRVEVPVLFLASAMKDAMPLMRLKPVGGLLKPLRDGDLEVILSMAENIVVERTDLKQKIQSLTAVVDGMLDSVFVVNAERSIVFANPTAARTTHCDALKGRDLRDFFAPDGDGNQELEATLNAALTGSSAIGSGSRATLRAADGVESQVVVIVSTVRDATGAVTGASMSFRLAPGGSAQTDQNPAAETESGNSDSSGGESELQSQNSLLRSKAIRSIELRLATESPTMKDYALVLLLSQFDMFRMRYGLNNAEKLVHAFSAHLIKSLSTEDRLYTWSNRTVVVLLERENSPDEVRLEMTSFCSRRVDYYLNAAGRSALVTLSASWNLIPLFDCPEAKKDPRKIVDQIDAFERMYTRRK